MQWYSSRIGAVEPAPVQCCLRLGCSWLGILSSQAELQVPLPLQVEPREA